jgi:hypothetical protein
MGDLCRPRSERSPVLAQSRGRKLAALTARTVVNVKVSEQLAMILRAHHVAVVDEHLDLDPERCERLTDVHT